MNPSLSIEYEKVKKAIGGLFPGDSNLRMREAIMRVHCSFGELPMLSRAVMGAVATASRFQAGPVLRPNERDNANQYLPNDFDEWTNYFYAEILAGLGWLARIERDILEMGEEVRRVIVRRERARRSAEEKRAEKEYAERDAVQYQFHLSTLREGDVDANSGTGPAAGGSPAGGGEEGTGGGGGSGRSGEDEASGTAGELHPGGRPSTETPAAKAARILRG